MKIASFCSFVGDNEIGGGQTAAFQFREWCDILGVECDVVTLKDNIGATVSKMGVTRFNNIEEIEAQYDFILFVTPSFGIYIDYISLSIPYAVMIRGETDDVLFGGVDKIKEICKYAKIVIFNSPVYYGIRCDFVYCVMSPKYRIRENYSIDDKTILEKSGLVYSGRISKLKDAQALAKITRDDEFLGSVGEVLVYGYYNSNSTRAGDLEGEISSICPRWTMMKEKLVTYDYEGMKINLIDKQFIWEYSSVITKRRFNIACLEAMHFGCLPVVNRKAIPPKFAEKSYVFDPSEIKSVSENRRTDETYKMIEDLADSYYSFDNMLEMNANLIRKIME